MRAVVVVGVLGVASCGGSSKPAAAPAPAPAPPDRVIPPRVQIEDSDTAEEGIKIINARGHMEPSAVSAGIEPHESELTDCYMTKVNRRRWLGGHVTVKWDIRADGKVTSVKLSEADLGAHDIERCLLDVAKSATFAKPIGGDADFTLPLDFSAKGGAQPWDEDQSLRAVGGQLAKLDACDKKLKGETAPHDVVITAYVGARGVVQSVGFSSGTTEIGAKWAECASKVATTWRLPDPRGQVAKLAVRFRSKS
jgi:TonB family protein